MYTANDRWLGQLIASPKVVTHLQRHFLVWLDTTTQQQQGLALAQATAVSFPSNSLTVSNVLWVYQRTVRLLLGQEAAAA